MKNLVEIDRHRAVVIIGPHQVSHMRPPSPADLGLRDLRPQLFRFDLDVSEEPVGFAIEEDRVVARGVSPQRLLQLRPDGLVAALVLALITRSQNHHKCFANHSLPSWSALARNWYSAKTLLQRPLVGFRGIYLDVRIQLLLQREDEQSIREGRRLNAGFAQQAGEQPPVSDE